MTRTENDLRNALRELEQRADRHGAPFTGDSIRAAVTEDRLSGDVAPRRSGRWIPPVAAAASVAAAVTAFALTQHSSAPPRQPAASAQSSGSRPSASHSAAPAAPSSPARPTPTTSGGPAPTASAARILDDAAAEPAPKPWTPPAGKNFFYVRTTQATTWTSVSGTRAGSGHNADGVQISVPGCRNGQFVGGESGGCSLNDVPRYLGDAPTAPRAWDAYLERLAPGAKAAGAQGKFIVQVLHEDLVAPKAVAALLRYTERCPSLHTLAVRPVAGEKLVGVTCTSMTAGSYALVFDARSHVFVGFTMVTGSGRQDGPAEIVRRTGIVPAIGRTP